MGGSDAETPSKAPKTSSAQPPAASSSPAPAAAVYPDWSGFQAYSPIPHHGFFPSVASSPQAHPYMWGAQHLMPPYGTPPHPYVMYPHGGLYAHPSMPPGPHPFSPYAMPSPNGTTEASGAGTGGTEGDGKSSDAKERSALKRSKGSLGSLNMITGKNNNEVGKTSGASANGVYSQRKNLGTSSGESGSEGSSEGSDANSQNDSQPKSGGGQDSFEAVEASQNGSAARSSQNGFTPSQGMLAQTMPIMPMPAAGAPGGVAGPTTNLNIGMEYWGASTSSPIAPMRGKVPNSSVAGGMVPSSQNISSELWLQDERELKRQRRKQSNRESARRSRLRKQAECEELAQRVEVLKEENNVLRVEVSQLRKDYEQLLSQNVSLKERLGEIPRGSEDSKLDKTEQQPTGDGCQRHLDSEAQSGKTDGQSGH